MAAETAAVGSPQSEKGSLMTKTAMSVAILEKMRCDVTDYKMDIAAERNPEPPQRLDHIGFILDRLDQVDAWHDYLVASGVRIKKPPKTHRDGARSFYCLDPDGNLVQFIYHPPLVGKL